MYGLVKGKMTEETPYHPSSVKGEIRARIAAIMEQGHHGDDFTLRQSRATFWGISKPV